MIGIFLAWLVARSDIPYRKFIAAAAVIPYMVPSYIHALSWLTLFKNERVGGVSGIFQYLTGIVPPDWVSYGIFPIIITLSLHYFPYSFLLVSAALTSIDSRLEESGEILGASRGYILAPHNSATCYACNPFKFYSDLFKNSRYFRNAHIFLARL